MQAAILLNKKKVSVATPADLSITFDNATVGDKTIIDQSANARVFTRATMGGSAGDGVVNDPTFGMCYKFDGYSYFNCTNPLQFSKGNYRLEMDFVTKQTTYGVPFRSGDYSAHGVQQGLCIILNQTAGDYFQCFFTNTLTYQRIYFTPETNPGPTVLEKMVITKQGNTITIKNNRTGVQSSGTLSFTQNADSYLALGVSDALTTAYSFVGLLKRLEIFLLP